MSDEIIKKNNVYEVEIPLLIKQIKNFLNEETLNVYNDERLVSKFDKEKLNKEGKQ